MGEYDHVTDEMFDAELARLVDGMSASELLAVPGVYEALSEELNNKVLDAFEPLPGTSGARMPVTAWILPFNVRTTDKRMVWPRPVTEIRCPVPILEGKQDDEALQVIGRLDHLWVEDGWLRGSGRAHGLTEGKTYGLEPNLDVAAAIESDTGQTMTDWDLGAVVIGDRPAWKGSSLMRVDEEGS